MKIFSLTIYALALTVSCTPRFFNSQVKKNQGVESPSLSPNDIAILFRLPQIQENEDADLSTLLKTWLIRAADPVRQILPPNSIRNMLSQFSWPENKDVDSIREALSREDMWYMTSMRVGCTSVIKPDNDDCRITLRLVLQPIQWSRNILTFQKENTRAPLDGSATKNEDPAPIPNNAITTEDAAVHLIYELEGGRSRLVLNKMRELAQGVRTSYGIHTTKYPLGVHPAFEPGRLDDTQREGFLRQITEVLKDFARFEDLHSAEMLVTSGVSFDIPLPITWTFGTFRRDSKNQLSQVPIGRGIRSHRSGEVAYSQSLSFTEGYVPKLVDKETSFFDIVERWRKQDAHARTGSTIHLQREFAKINRIAGYVDDPRNLSILMSDCVTCHTSSTLRNLSMHPKAKSATYAIKDQAERLKQYKQILFSAYPSSLPAEVEPLTEVSVTPVIPDYNLHQFSYFLHRPSISKRAANDIAFDVVHFNQLLSTVI